MTSAVSLHTAAAAAAATAAAASRLLCCNFRCRPVVRQFGVWPRSGAGRAAAPWTARTGQLPHQQAAAAKHQLQQQVWQQRIGTTGVPHSRVFQNLLYIIPTSEPSAGSTGSGRSGGSNISGTWRSCSMAGGSGSVVSSISGSGIRGCSRRLAQAGCSPLTKRKAEGRFAAERTSAERTEGSEGRTVARVGRAAALHASPAAPGLHAFPPGLSPAWLGSWRRNLLQLPAAASILPWQNSRTSGALLLSSSVAAAPAHRGKPPAVAAAVAADADSLAEEGEGGGNGRGNGLRGGSGEVGGGGDGDGVTTVELHEEMSQSYVAYAMSVIVGRALPDVRDGLKPVHRRILYAMSELGLASNKPYRKSARVVGEVLGKFHPHGDSAVYDALVRMAQDFSMGAPLVAGHGNFGSVDADPAAAMRYTECRLQALSEKMLLEDLGLDTVDFVPNFDSSYKEPSVLPARLPHLLINGSQGIAVGMATSIPPHNLREVVDALLLFLHHPNATVQQLMEHVAGPDFPTGGIIIGRNGIEDAYLNGRGSVVMRGKAFVEELGGKTTRSAIVITELPYQTNKASLVGKIADLVNSKVIEGVSDVRDESDRSGMRVVVEVKRGATPMAVLAQLYKHTSLQSRFNCNFVGLVNGEPREMNLRDFFEVFVEFRSKVVVRRALHLLGRAQDREHHVEGLLTAVRNLGRVVEVLRSSPSPSTASTVLQQEFSLSPTQCDGVLSMPMRRLTSMEVEKLEREHEQLQVEIKDLQDLVGNRKRVLQVIEKEAKALRDEFGYDRRTTIEADGAGAGNAVLDPTQYIPNDPILVSMSEKGYVKRMSPDTFTAQRRGTAGKSGGKLKTDDVLCRFVVCNAHDSILFFSDKGTAYSLKGFQIPEGSRAAIGQSISQLLPLRTDERITSILPVSVFSEDTSLIMLTRRGIIKRTSLKAFADTRKNGLIAIQLEEGDELKWVRQATSDNTVVIGARGGNVVRFKCDDSALRSLGRATRGVKAMSLEEADEVAAMEIVPADDGSSGGGGGGPWLLVVTSKGVGKRVPVSEFKPGRRGNKGVIGIKLAQDDHLVALHVVGAAAAVEREDAAAAATAAAAAAAAEAAEDLSSSRPASEEVLSEGEGGVEEEDGMISEGECEGSSDEGAVNISEEVLIGSVNGIINRIRAGDVRAMGRISRGSSLMRMGAGDAVSAVSIIPIQSPDRQKS